MTTTSALVLYATEISHQYFNPELKIENRILPDSVPDNHVRVQPIVVGICGSDIHMIQTRKNSKKIIFSAPMTIEKNGRVIGHEGIAKVVSIGSGVTGFNVGDWVVPSSIYHCGICEPCSQGHLNQCAEARLLGTQMDGLFANLADLNKKLLLNVTPYIKNHKSIFALAALEPAATSLQACELAYLNSKKSLIIYGAGPIGAYAAMLAKLVFKCSLIIVIEPTERRRKLVEKWADKVYSSLADFFNSDFKDQKFDAAIEASGYLDNISQILTRIKPMGNIVLLARSGESLNLTEVDHLITNAISIRGCRGQLGGYMNRIAELYNSGDFPMDSLIEVAGTDLKNLADILQNNPSEISKHYCKAVIKL